MHGRAHDEVLLTALECAGRIGISVRTLRLYEQHGLISPRRTSKQWRLYGGSELARLNEILALKTLGLSLRDIAKLLKERPTDLAQTLTLQRDALTEARSRATRGLRVIDALQAKIGAGTAPSVDDLIHLARETKMNEPSHETAAWRRYEQMRPRTEVAIDPRLLDDYAAAYETEDGTLSIVSRQGDTLFYRIVGQSDIEIFPESNSEFFMKVLPVQLKFRRDADGQVVGLIHHQNGFEDSAERTALEPVLAIENDVQQRIRDQKPMVKSEAILRRLIDQLSRGEPDLDGMAPALAALVTEQKEGIQKEMEDAGNLKTLSFKGVSEGLDIYDVQFAKAKMEWGFALTHRGKVSHLYLRPSL
ncbi:MAG: MerR family transcriptional regulator [Shinella sp.]|uniref:MerR family transcriptional regulator n=1 Tax=Shinella sp. TaxID=1870904 RepID=UPI003C785EC6